VRTKTADPDSFAGFGLARRRVFGHRALVLAKPYPDACLLLERRGMPPSFLQRGEFRQLNLYTTEFHELPEELFTDQEVNWHGQQLGLRGLIAAAGLFIDGDAVFVSTLQSDLCQQLYRHAALRRHFKTRVETRFKYWYVLLLNAILDFCLDHGLRTLYCPTGAEVVTRTRRNIDPALFFRIYDCPPRRYLCTKLEVQGCTYWQIRLTDNIDRIVPLRPTGPSTARDDRRLAVCVFHDIEENVDAPAPAGECADNLARMLRIEREHGIEATYNVLGRLLHRKKGEILAANGGHALGFHSFNHDVADERQLPQCREVDLRIRGYRPPQSRLTEEISEYNLAKLNFEWLASSASSLGRWQCDLQNGVVKIPIHLDDFPLFTGAMRYEEWEAHIFELAERYGFLSVSTHDCYGSHWLERYGLLLEKLARFGAFMTADALCERILIDESLPLATAATVETAAASP
jgi:peptidoglycan/xylan/chitin deacetylase (PgdA/CDA1 family)